MKNTRSLAEWERWRELSNKLVPKKIFDYCCKGSETQAKESKPLDRERASKATTKQKARF